DSGSLGGRRSRVCGYSGRGGRSRLLLRLIDERPSRDHEQAKHSRQKRAHFRRHFLALAHERTSLVAQASACGFWFFPRPNPHRLKPALLFAARENSPASGTRSTPPGVKGWQRERRRSASHEPRRAPWIRTASAA